jgi:hypothetical protein
MGLIFNLASNLAELFFSAESGRRTGAGRLR